MNALAALLVAAIGSVAVGAAFVAAPAAVADENTAEPAMTVPVGRVGDRVGYALANVGENPVQGIEVLGHAVIGDREGTQREALRVRLIDGSRDDRVVFVDLAHRLRLVEELRTIDHAGRYVHHVFLEPALTWAPGFPFQGRELHVGQPLDLVGDLPRPDRGGFRPGLHFESWLLRLSPDLEPRDAHTWVAGEEGPEETAQTIVQSRVENPIVGCQWVNATRQCDEIGVARLSASIRLVDGLPYPVRMDMNEEVVYANGTSAHHQQTWVLSTYQPGTGGTIRWQPYENRLPFTGQNVHLERVEGATFPADGSDSQGPYPLGEAIDDALGAPALASFQAWKRAHPHAYLISAHMRPEIWSNHPVLEEMTASSYRWRLGFAEASGAGYVVEVERVGLLMVDAADYGTHAFSPFDPTGFPNRPVTIGAAMAMSKAILPETTSWTINAISWGDRVDTTPGSDGGILGNGDARPPAIVSFRRGFDALHVSTINLIVSPLLWHAGLSLNLTSGLTAGGFSLGGDVPPASFRDFGNASREAEPERMPQAAGVVTTPHSVLPVVGVAALGSGLLVASAYYWPILRATGVRWLWLVSGYTLLKRDRLLDQRVRDALMEQIRQEPGIHASELLRRVQIGWGSLVHHLSMLQRNGLVTSLLDGRHRRFFPAEGVDRRDRSRLAALANGRTKTLYHHILDEPGIATGELARRLHVTLPTAGWHLRRLEEAGLVERRKRGRSVHFFPLQATVAAPAGPALPAPSAA